MILVLVQSMWGIEVPDGGQPGLRTNLTSKVSCINAPTCSTLVVNTWNYLDKSILRPGSNLFKLNRILFLPNGMQKFYTKALKNRNLSCFHLKYTLFY